GRRERHRALWNVLHRDGREVRPGLRQGAAGRRLRLRAADASALRVGRWAGDARPGSRCRTDGHHLRESGRRPAEEVSDAASGPAGPRRAAGPIAGTNRFAEAVAVARALPPMVLQSPSRALRRATRTN